VTNGADSSVRGYINAISRKNPDAKVIENDSSNEPMLNKDYYQNLKAQAWWGLRRRFEKTHKMVNGEETYPHDDLISLDSTMPKAFTEDASRNIVISLV
jgi:hypothetical protein